MPERAARGAAGRPATVRASAPPRTSLRRILARQFMLTASLPLLLFIAFWSFVSFPRAVADIERENAQTATLLRKQIEAVLRVPQRALETTAALMADLPPRPGLASALMRQALAGESAFEDLCVADEQGIVTDASARPSAGVRAGDLVGLDLSTRPFYALAQARDATVWSDTFLSPLTGHVTAVLAQPVGKRLLVAEMSLGGLAAELAQFERPAQAVVVVLDGKGRVIVHPNQQLAAWQENLGRVPLVETALRGSPGAGEIELEGERWMATVAQVQPAGWYVLVAQRRALLFAPLLQIGIAGGATAALALVLAVVIALRLAAREATRYRRLAAAAQAMVDDPSRDAGREPELESEETHELWLRLRAVLDRLQEQEQEASGARHHLQSVLDAATEVAVVETDVDGTVRLFNRGAEKMLGRRSADVVDALSPIAWHDGEELAARAARLAERLGRPVLGFEILCAVARDAGYEVRDWTLVRQDGTRLLASVAVTAMRGAQGELRGYVCVAVDQTERERAAELESARERAEVASRAKSEFLSRVSHELRTPLNAMLGYAQLLTLPDERPLSPSQVERVRLIETAGWHLVRLIDDVLDLSRIEGGHMTLSIEPLDLRSVLADAARLVAPQAAARGVAIALPDAGASAPAAWSACADGTRLRQVFVNLFSNAVKYNVAGGRVDVSRIEGPAGMVGVRVADTGHGLDPAQMSRLFAPFDRLGLEAGGVEGTGIGLVITKRLLELMDGRIEVESTPNVGSSFSVFLPTAGAAHGAPGPAHAGPPQADASVAGAVVYVEDNEVNALLMSAVFALRPGCTLHLCDTLAAARTLIPQLRPRLVLVDMHLPDGSGLTLLEWLHADRQLRDIPAVVLSADATRSQQDAAARAGARAYLTKPIQLAETLRVVDGILRAGTDTAAAGGPPGG
jgi:PAS domain S-box-containing protein